jgi:uracil-DNA glycosylase family 4
MSVILNTKNYPKSTIGLSASRSADNALRIALLQKGLNYVGIRGNPHSHVCILGEAPGEREDLKGLPFIGPSGYLLDKMLNEAGFSDKEVWFTNPFKVRPPDNKIDRLHELGIPGKVLLDAFWEELDYYKPTIIVSCGKTPTQLLCPFTKPTRIIKKQDEKKDGFGHWRGSLLTSPLLTWEHYVIPIYHPAFVLRQYSEREISIFILQRAFEEYSYWKKHGHLQPLPQFTILTEPTFEQACEFLDRCIVSPNPISIDIELLRRKVPYTIAFAISINEAMSMSFWNYTPSQLVILWRKIDIILQTKILIGQNVCSFDHHWLRALGFSPNLNNTHCTLVRHHILWAGLRHKLEFQGMQYTRIPFWKEEGHSWSPKQGMKKLMNYNALDTLGDYIIFEEQEKEFRERAGK